MKLSSTHQEIRLRITAFLFNRRADALRGEIYRALCLYVLSEIGTEMQRDELVELVAYSLGCASITDSLRTIVLDELNQLVRDGVVHQSGDEFLLGDAGALELPDVAAQEQMNEALLAEVWRIARDIKPDIVKSEIDTLHCFFLEASSVIAQSQLLFICRGLHIQAYEPELSEKVPVLISDLRKDSSLDSIIDVDKFVLRCFVHPSPILAGYLYRLVQVCVIAQLLAWDPSLEYLQKRVLGGRALYLDTNIIFIIMQSTHPLHHFLTSLLAATHNDLGATLRVQEITLGEYESVVEWADRNFNDTQRTLRDVAQSCKRHNENPYDSFQHSIYVDYIARNMEHIDLGTWNRYRRSMTGNQLLQTLANMGITVDREQTFVPEQDFIPIKDALVAASRVQMAKGKRLYEKPDLDHDARMYYFLTGTRHKTSQDDMSLGYDRYLLTLDGSLVPFMQLFGIPWTESFFIYPNQWYELTFPFLRLNISQNPELETQLVSLVCWGAFPDLTSLVPLELCQYVFESGGQGLSIGSVQSIIKTLLEERLIEALDPASTNTRKREEARLRVERMVAAHEIRERRTVDTLKRQATDVRHQMAQVERAVQALKQERKALQGELAEMKTAVETLDGDHDAVRAAEERFEAQLQAMSCAHSGQMEKLSEQVRAKEDELAQQYEQHGRLQDRLQTLERTVEQSEQRVERERLRRLEKARLIRQIALTLLMLTGLAGALVMLILYQSPLGWTVTAALGLVGGIVTYWSCPGHPVVAAGLYSVGLIVATGVIVTTQNLTMLLWLVPVIWDFFLFLLDRFLRTRTGAPHDARGAD